MIHCSQFASLRLQRGERLYLRKKERNHTVSLFFSIFYDISNELRSTDFP